MKTRASLAAAALIALAVSLPAVAQSFKVPPTPDHYVTDNAGVLSSDTRASLENELHAYESATGHQIVVWIGQTTGDVPLETWTAQTADHWKIGRRGHDDGAVLFIFMQDHKVRIEVGYGLESALTDADSSRIIQNVIRPRMRSGDVDGAVTSGVAAILLTITPNYASVTPPSGAPDQTPVETGIGVVVVALLGLTFAFIVLMVVMRIIATIRYGYLVLREGSSRAKNDMRNWWFWGGVGTGSMFSGWGGGGGGGGFGGGFSAGGGGFGGGGASGGW